MKRLKTVLPIIIACIFFDQITKLMAKVYLQNSPTISFLWDTCRLTYAQNKGAFLSLGSNWPEWLRFSLLTGVVTVALIVFTYFVFFKLKDYNHASLIAMALILGGGWSNQVDRIFQGSVIDFMNMGILKLRTGIFNVADMAIMAGFFMMIFFNRSAKPKQKPIAESN